MLTVRNAHSWLKVESCRAGFKSDEKVSCSVFHPSKTALFSEGTMSAETHSVCEENVKKSNSGTCRPWYTVCTFAVCRKHHTINRAAFVCLSVCLSVCSLSPPRSFDRSSPNLVGVCRWTSELPLGFFFEKVSGSTGQRVTFTFHYIIYAPASCHTLQRLLLLAAVPAPESNSAPFARRLLHCISTVYIGGP